MRSTVMTRGMPDNPAIERSSARAQKHLAAIPTVIGRTRQGLTERRHEQEAGRTCDESSAVVRGAERANNTIVSLVGVVGALTHSVAKRARGRATPERACERTGETALLNGPALASADRVSPDVTDAMFS